jgi:inosine/xanthosine triphosphate pyrophosphatase family protein
MDMMRSFPERLMAASSGRCAAIRGHGYDPIFQPDGHDITFGEMDRWEKNRISHRADAFAKLVKIFGPA